MNAYVAGSWKDPAVPQTMAALIRSGHTFTYDWTKVMVPKPYRKHEAVNRATARRMVARVKLADALVLVDSLSLHGARYECGVAIGANVPVYVLRSKRDSIFYTLPGVCCVESLAELLEALA